MFVTAITIDSWQITDGYLFVTAITNDSWQIADGLTVHVAPLCAMIHAAYTHNHPTF